MKKNYSSPAIETMTIMLSSVILEGSENPSVTTDPNNGFGSAPKRSTQPF